MYSKNSYSLSTFWKYNSQRWEQSILCPQGILAIRNEVIWPCLDWFSCCLLLICKIVYLFLSFWQDLKEAENDWATVFIYGRLEFMGYCWLNGSAQRPKKKSADLKNGRKWNLFSPTVWVGDTQNSEKVYLFIKRKIFNWYNSKYYTQFRHITHKKFNSYTWQSETCRSEKLSLVNPKGWHHQTCSFSDLNYI